jgi:hypothetical protein
MVIIMTVFSAVCIAAGAFGICAVFQFNTGTLTALWIILSVCLVGFSAGAALGLATPLLLQSYGCTSPVYPAIYSIANQTVLAAQRLCVTNNCQCYINSTGSFNTSGITGLNSSSNYTLPISVLQCINWVPGLYDRLIASF